MSDNAPKDSAYSALLKSALTYAAAVDKDESHAISAAEKQLSFAAIYYAGSVAAKTSDVVRNLFKPRPSGKK